MQLIAFEAEEALLLAFEVEVGRPCRLEFDDSPDCWPYYITVWVEPISIDGPSLYGIGASVSEALEDCRHAIRMK